MIPEFLLLGLSTSGVPSTGSSFDSMSGTRSSIRRAGDVNGDGVPDLLVSDAIPELPPDRVWVVSGKDGSVLLRVSGRDPEDDFGHSMDGVGDVDGDGHADFVVAAQGAHWAKRSDGTYEILRTGSAYARVYSGVDGRVLQEFAPKERDQRFGMSVAGAGDIDGDGRPDVIIGLSFGDAARSGEVLVLSGRNGTVLQRFGDLMGLGISVSSSGDLDGDGHDDVLVGDGSAFNARAGRLRAFSGKGGRLLLTVWPEDKNEAFPWSIATAGDLNGDRVPDILVSEESRFVRALSGKDGSTLHEWSSHGRNAYIDAFGSSLDSLGDIDGDGVPDVIVGANESPLTGFDEGYATVFSGKDGHVLYEYRAPNEGIDVSGLGDVDGDHVPDFALCVTAKHLVMMRSGESFATIRDLDWTKFGDPPASGKK